MRKFTAIMTLFVMILAVFAFPLSARADVIYDPVGDFLDSASGVIIAVMIVAAVVAVIAGTVILLIVLLKRKK